MVKNPPAMQETPIWSLGWEDALEKGMTTNSRILAWRIPQTEEPGRLHFMGLQRVGQNWVTFTFTLIQNWPIITDTVCLTLNASSTNKKQWVLIVKIETSQNMEHGKWKSCFQPQNHSCLVFSSLYFSTYIQMEEDFAGGPLAKTPCSQRRWPRFNPWSAN